MQHSVKRFPIGSHLIVKHLGYSHHGIYAGRGRVIHYSGLAHLFKKKPIEITTLEQFSHGKKFMSVITIIQNIKDVSWYGVCVRVCTKIIIT